MGQKCACNCSKSPDIKDNDIAIDINENPELL